MNRFLALRYERGITQAQLAKGAGVSRGTLWAIERGTTPSAPVAKALADYYGVTVADLLAPAEDAA